MTLKFSDEKNAETVEKAKKSGTDPVATETPTVTETPAVTP